MSEIAVASSPSGSPPPSGLRIFPKNEWFAWPPRLLRSAVRALGHEIEIGDHLLDRRVGPLRPFERCVDVRDVGRVVLVVVDAHCELGDGGLERVVRVRKRSQFVCHGSSSQLLGAAPSRRRERSAGPLGCRPGRRRQRRRARQRNVGVLSGRRNRRGMTSLTYRERPPARSPAGLLVLHHGRGADERDLLPLADVLDAKRRLHAGADPVIGVSLGRRPSELLKKRLSRRGVPRVRRGPQHRPAAHPRHDRVARRHGAARPAR